MLTMIAATFPLFKGIADALVVLVVGRLLIYGYREHAYLYQLEDRSRLFDRWVQFLLPVTRRLKMPRYRHFISLSMARAASRRDWDADHFLASQCVYAALGAAVSYALVGIVMNGSFALVVGLTAIATALPALKLHDVASSRYRSCNKDLPFFIDYLALSMGAGLDFNQGLAKVVDDAPKAALAEEFRLVQLNIQLGMTRAEALIEMERRLQSPVLKLFVQTLVQATELGTDVGHTLGVISETLTQKRFQLAEEMAGKISVRMMIPMMLFVMPAVLIVLLGPMILSYMQLM